jgi:hypothetical protein
MSFESVNISKPDAEKILRLINFGRKNGNEVEFKYIKYDIFLLDLST